MDLSLEVFEGEKLGTDMEELGNQIANAWKDPAAAVFLEKYNAVCSTLYESVRKLGDL